MIEKKISSSNRARRSWACVASSVIALASSDARAEAACDREDRALEGLAEELSRARLRGDSLPSPEAAARKLRGEGAVFPSLRWLVIAPRASQTNDAEQAPRLDPAQLKRRAQTFARGIVAPRRACGIAVSRDERGNEIAVIVAAPEHASVTPVPTSSRLGSWITVRARFFDDVPRARIVVLGPRGAPRSVPSSLVDGELVGRFSADQNGLFSAQIVGETDEGPLPLVELSTRVGAAVLEEEQAPGETVLAHDRPATVFAMLNAARTGERSAALTRSSSLDALAEAHARILAERGRIAHDAGDGDPAARVSAAGLSANEVGENVAQAGSIEACHRALWRSPSHRENLLSPRFREVGVGVARGKDGATFVVQLFKG